MLKSGQFMNTGQNRLTDIVNDKKISDKEAV